MVFAGLSVSTLTCGPVVFVVHMFQALAYIIFRTGPIRWLTDSLILSTAYTFRTWANHLKGKVEPVRSFSLIGTRTRPNCRQAEDDLDDSHTDVSSTHGVHQDETGLAEFLNRSQTLLISILNLWTGSSLFVLRSQRTLFASRRDRSVGPRDQPHSSSPR